jgi:hypothetical protein
VAAAILTAWPAIARGQSTAIEVREDSAKFAAVVRKIAEGVSGELRIDPRPLMDNPSVAFLDGFAYRSDRAEMTAARTKFVQVRGYEVLTDMGTHGCPGVMVPPSMHDRSQCPKAPVVLLAASLARPGDASFPGSLDPSADRSTAAYQSMRVIKTELSEFGFMTTVIDAVISGQGVSWTVVRMVDQAIIH